MQKPGMNHQRQLWEQMMSNSCVNNNNNNDDFIAARTCEGLRDK